MLHAVDWERAAMGFTTVEMLLDDVAKRMSSSNLARFSRVSGGQRTGGSMRVVKPTSANNSPRGSGLARRRTVMNDGAYRRRVAMMEQSAMASTGYLSNESLQVPPRSSRPVSWHPASHLSSEATYPSPYPTSTSELDPQYQYFDSPSTPAVYSGYTSPASVFSPLTMPYTGYEQSFYQPQSTLYQTNVPYMASETTYMDQNSASVEQLSSATTDSSMYSQLDWAGYAVNEHKSCSTAPPTPENFLPLQHAEPAFSPEESIPYHSLSDSEDEGEELVGMGLYDTPENTKTALDPQLDNYKTMMMMSQFLGGSYRRPEPTGKGLKLEETWNPPASDDEDEDDDEQDGEGEDEEEEFVEEAQTKVEQTTTQVMPPQGQYSNTSFQTNLVPQSYCHNGWL